jgi:Tol biopolymer transport system component
MRVVFKGREGRNLVHPTFSPDGSRIACEGDGVIFVDGERVVDKDLYPNGNSHCPIWSPKGDKILFIREDDDIFRLYVTDPEGKEMHPLHTFDLGRNGLDNHGNFSPDGKQVAFWYHGIGEHGGERALCLADVYTGKTEKMPVTGCLDIDSIPPRWSPDGKEIVFSTRVEAVDRLGRKVHNSRINKIRPDGTELAELTSGYDDCRLFGCTI